jgi:hypothetical protein
MTHARYAITQHNPTWKEKIPKEDTLGERALRRILESLSRELEGLTFKSQDGRYDFWLCGIPIDVQGPSHQKQTQRDHDAFKASEAIKAGFPAPILIEQQDILDHPDLVRQLLRTLALMQPGVTEKEAAAK